MITHQDTSIPATHKPVVLKYALIPVHGYGIAVATVARMLDGDAASGERARVLGPADSIPYGAQPVLLADTTVYGMKRVEELLLRWGSLPKPWLVLISDAPARPVPDVRYLVRALEGRLAGVARVPYLPVFRAVKDPDEALEYKDVQAAAQGLRRKIEGDRR
ncbi:hypothetical protein OG280_41310 (plasmid) [Streptomyces virginiae]|uniref:hypothetical protein n=1 Tax=Streptomyces virginiae TaxID=1961 RepID=UPI002DDB9385|nr:hypothetical protein [Streptomyces virginiae]WSC82771.1 hypothetical protein OHA56_40950 [Streptomyces virginiae]